MPYTNNLLPMSPNYPLKSNLNHFTASNLILKDHVVCGITWEVVYIKYFLLMHYQLNLIAIAILNSNLLGLWINLQKPDYVIVLQVGSSFQGSFLL